MADDKRARFAGVNSFGFGGTNAHALLTEAPPGDIHPPVEAEQTAAAHLLPISARSHVALEAYARDILAFLRTQEAEPEPSLQEIEYNLSLRRTHHDHRLTVVVRSKQELIGNLESFFSGERPPGMHSGHTAAKQKHKVAFVFSGQGPQWWAMGRQLLEHEPVFRESIERCDRVVAQYAQWSLLDELTAAEERSRLQETSIAQPALFALQAGLSALWLSWGVAPSAVVGHSVGEVAAAYIAGSTTWKPRSRRYSIAADVWIWPPLKAE